VLFLEQNLWKNAEFGLKLNAFYKKISNIIRTWQ